MNKDAMLFFNGHTDLLDVYEALEEYLLRRYPRTEIRVGKTQIGFSDRHLYACVSFLRPRRKSELPASYFTLTIGLPYPLDSPRAAAKTEPYPGRWTTHIVVSDKTDLDGELLDWIAQAHDFAVRK